MLTSTAGRQPDLVPVDDVDASRPRAQREPTAQSLLSVLVVAATATAAPGHLGGRDDRQPVLPDRLSEDSAT